MVQLIAAKWPRDGDGEVWRPAHGITEEEVQRWAPDFTSAIFFFINVDTDVV